VGAIACAVVCAGLGLVSLVLSYTVLNDRSRFVPDHTLYLYLGLFGIFVAAPVSAGAAALGAGLGQLLYDEASTVGGVDLSAWDRGERRS
jgi:hypothetical protein